jgi:2'-5' RNA ligase
MQRSVWLVPSVGDASALRSLIERCATALGSPTFPPHITLCTQSSAATLAAVSRSLPPPLPLTLTSVDFGDDYFHGCYLEAKDDTAVRALQTQCAAALGAKVPERYPPHLSLAYGVLSDEQRKMALALVTELPMQVTFEGLELWASDGPVSEWRKLA